MPFLTALLTGCIYSNSLVQNWHTGWNTNEGLVLGICTTDERDFSLMQL